MHARGVGFLNGFQRVETSDSGGPSHAVKPIPNYLSTIGLEAIWARTVGLTSRLKQGLKEIPGCRILTPESPQLSAALVSFAIEGYSGKDLTLALRERWKIIVKPLMHGGDGLRASVTFFQLEEEIDELLERLGQLVSERG